MKPKKLNSHICHDCGAGPGQLHEQGCDVESCPDCGGQLISCCCEAWDGWGDDGPPQERRIKWTGLWPGVMECEEFGWYAKLIPGSGWTSCSKDDPEAIHNLNRLFAEAYWDKFKRRWLRYDPKEINLN